MQTSSLAHFSRKATALISALALLLTLSPIQALAEQGEATPAATMPTSGTWGTCPWELDAEGTLVVYPGEGAELPDFYEGENAPPWMVTMHIWRSDVKRLIFKSEGEKKVKAPSDCSAMFCDINCKSSAVSIDCSGLDTSDVVNMAWMFAYCQSLEELNIQSFDTSKVTDMSCMFSGCSGIKTFDLSSFDTSNVTDMYAMFGEVNEDSNGIMAEKLDLSSFDTSKVTDMGGMFRQCRNLTEINLSSFDTSSVSDLGFHQMFDGCEKLVSLDLSGFVTSSAKDFYRMFAGCKSLTNINLSSFDTSLVESMDSMFAECSALVAMDLSSFETPSLTDMRCMFQNCTSLVSLDLSSFDTSKVVKKDNGFGDFRINTMRDLFTGCDALNNVKLGAKFSFKGGSDEVLTTLPDKKWRSVNENKYFTAQQIAETRNNIADTYTTLEPPKMVEGASNMTWSPGSSTRVRFRSDAPLELFVETRVDGKRIDLSNYKLSGGSTIVELTPAYLATLSAGKHTIDIVSQSGTASSTFSVVKETTQAPGDSSQNQSSTTTSDTQTMHRVYNPNSGEHFYTASVGEKDSLVKAGWTYEGVAWTAPKKSNTPVYRLYSGTDHHYTTSAAERDHLKSVGWKDEGTGWYSDDAKGVPLHRVYNPNVQPTAPRNNSGSHHYTISKGEADNLQKIGWHYENIGWYGVK